MYSIYRQCPFFRGREEWQKCLNVFIYNQKCFLSRCEKCDQRLPASIIIHLNLPGTELVSAHTAPPPQSPGKLCVSTLLSPCEALYYTGYPDVPTRHWERKCNSQAVMMRKRAWVQRRSTVAAHILCNIL